MEEQLADFIEQRRGRILPLLELIDREEPVDRASAHAVLGERSDFSRLRACFESSEVQDVLLRRQAAVLYRLYLPWQVEPEAAAALSECAARAIQPLHQVRADVGAGPLRWSELLNVFRSSKNTGQRMAAWAAVKSVALASAAPMLELVALRNRIARGLGFEDHLHFECALLDVDVAAIDRTVQEVEQGTEGSWRVIKRDLDRAVAAVHKTRPMALLPWQHEDPLRLVPSLVDEAVRSNVKDEFAAAQAHFRSLGHSLPAESRPPATRKSSTPPDAYERWLGLVRTVLKALSAMAARAADPSLPLLLRRPLHPILMAAVEQFFVEDLSLPENFAALLGISPQKASPMRLRLRESAAIESHIRPRYSAACWTLLREVYRHPGQDLSARFAEHFHRALGLEVKDDASVPLWTLLPDLQKPGLPSVVSLQGTLVAEQLRDSLPPTPEGRSLVRDKDSQRLIWEQIFAPSAARAWADTVKHFTGAALSSQAYVKRLKSR